MLEFVWNHKKMAAVVLVMLLGGGLYGGIRLLGAGGGKSAEWTTLNEQINDVLTRNEGGTPDAVKDSVQGRGPDRQENGAAAPVQNGASQSKQSAGAAGNGTDTSGSKSGTGNTAENKAQTQGQEQNNAVGGANAAETEAVGNASGSGNGNRQQTGNPSGSRSSNSIIDINSAPVSRLTDLPGIGESKAQAIVEYRKQSGGFRSPEELMKVKGIGQKTFDKLKERITVSP